VSFLGWAKAKEKETTWPTAWLRGWRTCMKRVMRIIFFTLLTFVVAMMIFIYCSGRVLKVNNNAKVFGANGKEIHCRVFNRYRTVKNSNEEDQKIKELILLFDHEMDGNMNVFVINPDFKLIGLPEGGGSSFTGLGNSILYQHTQRADVITSLVNNVTYFDDPYIKYANFYNHKVVFNSFGRLKQYGDSIIITF
jgi:hypothetical protein